MFENLHPGFAGPASRAGVGGQWSATGET